MQMDHLSREKFYNNLEQMLAQPSGSIHGAQEVRTLEGWDSLAILEFMTMASVEYDSDVEPTDLEECNTVDDLANVVFASRSSSK